MTETNDNAASLAMAFANKVREWASPAQFEEIRERNRTYEQGICASHDFMDANVAMFEAFKETFDREPQICAGDPLHEQDMLLWNRAWEIAKAEQLTSGEAPAQCGVDTQHPEECALIRSNGEGT